MTRLQDNLDPVLRDLVHPVPAVVGTADREFASTLLERLGAFILVHGRVDAGPAGAYAVFARVAQSTDRSVIHFDWHTRDRSPAYGNWSALIERLTPTHDVEVGEYPLEFATELEAVVRGIAAQVFLYAGNDAEAEDLFRRAISVAPASTSHQVDQLRTGLAKAIANQGRLSEAITFLQPRAAEATAAPDLLRTYGAFLLDAHQSHGLPLDRDFLIEILRRAADHETDPLRDMSLYNLAQQLSSSGSANMNEEAATILFRLKRTSRFYRKTWYLHRDIGSLAYSKGLAALEEGDVRRAREHGREASKWYWEAIRRRPRRRFFYREAGRLYVIRSFARSPILAANAVDAADLAGQKLRKRWLEWRFKRLREAFMKRSERALHTGDWVAAYSYGEWAIVGRRDRVEAHAKALTAIAAKQMGDDARADAVWREALDLDPLTLVYRAELFGLPSLSRGVPGDEPTETAAVVAELVRLSVLVPSDDAE
jgi:tetratricopeptide (TPR) repeat protein